MKKLIFFLLFAGCISAQVSDSAPIALSTATITGPLVVYDDNQKLVATITDDTVVLAEGVQPDRVIHLLVKYMMEANARNYTQSQSELKACMDGWDHTLELMKKSLKTKHPALAGSK